MKKLHLAICDDEARIMSLIANAIEGAFSQKGIDVTMEQFSNPLELKKRITQTEFDLLFLDIDMPKLDGIRLAQLLRQQQKTLDIIFVSSREDRVFEAFNVHPFGFVRKSAFLTDIVTAVDSYVNYLGESTKTRLSVDTSDGTVSVPLREIVYIESIGKEQLIHLYSKPEPVSVRLTMSGLMGALEDQGFARCHKGYIVNFQHILAINKADISMDNGVKVPIGRSYAQDVRDQYLRFLAAENAVTL